MIQKHENLQTVVNKSRQKYILKMIWHDLRMQKNVIANQKLQMSSYDESCTKKAVIFSKRSWQFYLLLYKY